MLSTRDIVGIDLDNTIILYDAVFRQCAETIGFTPPAGVPSKQALRDHLRSLPDGEAQWQRVQAAAYGPEIHRATPAPGVFDFLRQCHARGVPVWGVSHKTPFARAAPDGPNLRTAATDWLTRAGFFAEEFGLSPDRVFYESTRAEKIARVRALGCTHFIDDLEETFQEASFPDHVVQMHYTPGAPEGAGGFTDWQAISDYFRARWDG